MRPSRHASRRLSLRTTSWCAARDFALLAEATLRAVVLDARLVIECVEARQCLPGLRECPVSTNLDSPVLDALARNTSGVLETTRRLFRDPLFDTAVRQGTNTPGRVRYRISQLIEALRTLAD
jgi:hypothetical protein